METPKGVSNEMKKVATFLLIMCMLAGCANDEPHDEGVLTVIPVASSTLDHDILETLATIMYHDNCYQEEYWYCPPLDEVWRKIVVVDTCDNNTVISTGDCLQHLECHPQNGVIHVQQCTVDGVIGQQNVYCPKGLLEEGPCMPCAIELCNGIDDDCDGAIDEGLIQACSTACGEGFQLCIDGAWGDCDVATSEEVCDGLDNDCDGETDEGQLNACGTCGVLEEICNNVDDDCDGATDEDLFGKCTTPCEENLQECVMGQWICKAKQPNAEICDGIDNDCDGAVDEGLKCVCTEQDIGVLIECAAPPLTCGAGYVTCECVDDDCAEMQLTPCQALCVYVPSVLQPDEVCDPLLGQPIDEICNNHDDNCNLAVDEGLVETCYTGPISTLGIGLCLPGTWTCDAGAWGTFIDNVHQVGTCDGEIVPQEEICDGQDNDCDGEADLGEPMGDTDILFIVDSSGSMVEEYTAVLTALAAFAQSYDDEDALRWGLVFAPDDFEQVVYATDFVPFQEFLTHADDVSLSMSGNEPLLDIVYFATHGLVPGPYSLGELVWDGTAGSYIDIVDMTFSWRPEADHVVIVLSDEKAQSRTFVENNPTTKFTSLELKLMLSTAPRMFMYTVVSTDSMFGDYISYTGTASNYGWCQFADAASSGGKCFTLTSNPTTIYADLMTILDETACAK